MISCKSDSTGTNLIATTYKRIRVRFYRLRSANPLSNCTHHAAFFVNCFEYRSIATFAQFEYNIEYLLRRTGQTLLGQFLQFTENCQNSFVIFTNLDWDQRKTRITFSKTLLWSHDKHPHTIRQQRTQTNERKKENKSKITQKMVKTKIKIKLNWLRQSTKWIIGFFSFSCDVLWPFEWRINKIMNFVCDK